MSKQAPIIKLNPELGDNSNLNAKEIKLPSGRRIETSSHQTEDLVEISEPDGRISITIRLTEAGPVMTVEGARLELKSAESISMKAPKVKIEAEEEAVIDSRGKLKVNAGDEMAIHSEKDLVMTGDLIHLN